MREKLRPVAFAKFAIIKRTSEICCNHYNGDKRGQGGRDCVLRISSLLFRISAIEIMLSTQTPTYSIKDRLLSFCARWFDGGRTRERVSGRDLGFGSVAQFPEPCRLRARYLSSCTVFRSSSSYYFSLNPSLCLRLESVALTSTFSRKWHNFLAIVYTCRNLHGD